MKPIIKKYKPSAEYYFHEGCYITEVSNSENDPELSIARARVEPGKTTKWHMLNDIVERYVILEGAGRVEVAELEPVSVRVGDIVIIPSGQRQRIKNIGKVDLIFLAICTPRFKKSAYVSL